MNNMNKTNNLVHMTDANVLIRMPEVMRLTSLSRSSIYARINPNSASFDPSFPKQAKLSPGVPRSAAAWSLSEITEWVRARLEARAALKK